MKTIRLGLILLFVAGFARGEATSALEIKSYSSKDGVVIIKSGAGATNRPFSSFSTEEQQQITDWLADREFKSSGLNVEIEKSEASDEVKKLDFSEPRVAFRRGETKTVTYSVVVENRSVVPFNNIRLDSRLFIESMVAKSKLKTCFTETKTLSLAPGEKQKVSLRPALIRDELIQVSDQVVSGTVRSGDPTVHNQDRLVGMYLCVSKKDQNGSAIEHKFEDGNVPDEKRWADYRTLESPRR